MARKITLRGKKEIIQAHNRGCSNRTISKRFKIPEEQVQDIIQTAQDIERGEK